jgi:hypothetical protein
VVRVDGILEDFPADEDVQVRTLHGIGDGRGALLVRSADGVTLAVGDLLASLDRRRPLALLRAALLRREDVFLVRNRSALRDDLLRHAARPELVRLIEGARVVQRPEAAKTLELAAARL